MADNAPLKNCEKNSVSRLGSDRIEQTHELIVKSNFQLQIQQDTNLFIIMTLYITEICTVLNYNIYTRSNGPISHFKYETYFYIRLTVGMLILFKYK